MSTPDRINKLKAAMQGMATAPGGLPVTSASAAPTTEAGLVPTLRPPSRRGKRVVSAYIDAMAAKQLRLLAVEQDSSTQSLLEEALNDLFRKYNRSAVA
ncbi:MAG: ribbon-helix-helix domain-containing protein [Hyphomicrobium sp.]